LKATRILSLLAFALPLSAMADQLVPAGSIVTCTLSESVSSKTLRPGDPVMCTLGHTEQYGRSSFPYGAYLMGHFAEYKDPGHFVGKGWMVLDFDRMIVQPDTVVPLHARVVQDSSKLPVDADGKIHGTGHPVKDTVTWLIPVLWPIDLINLPRRGPTPVLKAETKLTLRVMDDFGIPTPMEDAVRKPALVARQTPDEPTYESYRQAAAPIERQQPQYAQQPQYQPQYQQQAYAQPSSPVVVNLVQPAQQQQQPIIIQQQAPQQQPVYIQQPAPRVVYNNYPPPPPPYAPYRYYYYRGY
jgi:hypothetical protein